MNMFRIAFRFTFLSMLLFGVLYPLAMTETARLIADFDPPVRQAMVRLMGRLARAAERRVTCEGGVCSLA